MLALITCLLFLGTVASNEIQCGYQKALFRDNKCCGATTSLPCSQPHTYYAGYWTEAERVWAFGMTLDEAADYYGFNASTATFYNNDLKMWSILVQWTDVQEAMKDSLSEYVRPGEVLIFNPSDGWAYTNKEIDALEYDFSGEESAVFECSAVETLLIGYDPEKHILGKCVGDQPPNALTPMTPTTYQDVNVTLDLSSVWTAKNLPVLENPHGFEQKISWEDIAKIAEKSNKKYIWLQAHNCWCPYSLGYVDGPQDYYSSGCGEGNAPAEAFIIPEVAKYAEIVVLFGDNPHFKEKNTTTGESIYNAATVGENGECLNYGDGEAYTSTSFYDMYTTKPTMIRSTRYEEFVLSPIGIHSIASPTSFIVDISTKRITTPIIYDSQTCPNEESRRTYFPFIFNKMGALSHGIELGFRPNPETASARRSLKAKPLVGKKSKHEVSK